MKNRQIMKLLVLLLFFAAMNCVQAYAVYQSTPPTTIWMIAPEISLDINTVNVTAGDALGFNISLYNPNEYVTVGNMSIKIGRRTESGPYEYLAENIITTDSALEFEANSTRILEYNWSSVGSAEGIYKVYAKFNYNGTYTTRYKTFNVVISGENDTGEDNETDSGDDSGGEEALETISIKGSLDFGSISTIGIRYDSGDMEYGKLRIIGYVSGPKKISQDLYEKTIYKDFCNTNTGVEIRNVHRHSRFYLNIPLIIKDNCDSKYDAGEYEITVRACNYVEGVWTYHKDSILKKKMNIQINENENDDCATASEINECEKCDYEAIFCRNGGLDSSLGKNAPETEKRHIYEIPEFDETVYIGDVFRTKITVFNNSSKNESGTVYS
ncbi:MAG: hypothetical protein U9P44_02660, partial [archaeon]|nr:hypothetical protein [archaeon]